ncbi:MAG: tyrosine-type recombinase/integrase [Pseudodesulfovibrio sp.]|uniref:tyrosine-type recombinase/integrase n=1 Tax=Pseudodesulfovibrio sp. TaxID=2035812 RepID=UPI003D112DA7
MAVKWVASRFPGVRYYEHTSRKHGVKFDRYFAIRAQVNGKRREEGLGWASEGWSEQKASTVLAELKKAHITGEGAHTLAEKRAQAKAERQARQEAEALEAQANVTFAQVFRENYLPAERLNKSKVSCDKEDGFLRNWIEPVFGHKPLKSVTPFDLERLKKKMLDAGKSPKTTHYVLGTVRQLFNFAKRHGLYEGENPVRLVKKPVSDNRRLRFLSKDEANRLLDALRERSQDLYDMALLSLHTGMRAGEIFTLTWLDVDLERRLLTLRDTKSGKNRTAFMTEDVAKMIEGRVAERLDAHGLVFPDRKGKKRVEVSNVFQIVADSIGMNNGVTDRRQKVVFHTLRHTYASWLVEQGVDLYTVKELMGHGTLAMTERYSHLAPDTLRRAVRTLEAGLKKGAAKVVNLDGSPAS